MTSPSATPSDFVYALSCAAKGFAATRGSWSKSVYVMQQNPAVNTANTLPYLWIRTADGNRVPWAPSNEDLFATDWEMVVKT